MLPATPPQRRPIRPPRHSTLLRCVWLAVARCLHARGSWLVGAAPWRSLPASGRPAAAPEPAPGPPGRAAPLMPWASPCRLWKSLLWLDKRPARQRFCWWCPFAPYRAAQRLWRGLPARSSSRVVARSAVAPRKPLRYQHATDANAQARRRGICSCFNSAKRCSSS